MSCVCEANALLCIRASSEMNCCHAKMDSCFVGNLDGSALVAIIPGEGARIIVAEKYILHREPGKTVLVFRRANQRREARSFVMA